MADEETKKLPELKATYLKDLSFEAPAGARIYLAEWKPKLQPEISLSAERLDKHAWEVVLSLKISVKVEKMMAMYIEAHQAGIFVDRDMDLDSLRRYIAEDVPAVLFSQLTETIRVLARNAGFPGIEFVPINFKKGWFVIDTEKIDLPPEEDQVPISSA